MKYQAWALIACCVASSAYANQRGLNIDDLVKMERVGAPSISPDGKQVMYTLRRTDMEKNKGVTDIWLQSLQSKNAEPQRLSTQGGHEPQWSAKGDAIYFLSSRSGSSQVWRLPLQGGEAQKVTDYPLDVESFRVSPQGDRILLSMSAFPECKDLACTKQKLEQRKKDKATGRIYDRLFVRHWDAWDDGRRSVLYSAKLEHDHKASTEPVNLSARLDGDVPSKPHGDREDYQFSPDGKQVVFALRAAGKTEAWSTNFDIYQVPVDGNAAPRNLTAENPAWDAKPKFSPDGKTLAYLAMRRPGFEADRFQLILLDLATGKKREVANSWDRSIADYQWSDDGKHMLVTADEVGQHKLFAIDLQSEQIKTLTGAGAVTGFDQHGDELVVNYNNLASDGQLYRLKLSQANQTDIAKLAPLTQVNKALFQQVRMADFEQFSFTGANGDTVYGHVMKPWNAKAGEKYPVAFIVHGGPQGSFGNKWGYRWNPQIYAGAGYAVVFIDFHGSTGYGQAFTDSISGDWGGKPLEDLKKGFAAASQKYTWLDSQRSCALGASYGGYMMNWIAGNWNDGFRCIVSHAGPFDTRGMYYVSEEVWFTEWENGGAYFNVPENHEKFNPARFVKNWKTPTLVIQGEMDFRIPTEQSLGTFQALQRRGIDSKLLIFPDENHWVSKPANSVLWHNTVLDWLNTYTRK